MLHFVFPSIVSIAGAFFGGWCGSVPISFIIWYIIHYGHPPKPDPDPNPWAKLSIAGIAGGIITGILVSGFSQNRDIISSADVLLSSIVGIIGGVIGSSIAAANTLKNNFNQTVIR